MLLIHRYSTPFLTFAHDGDAYRVLMRKPDGKVPHGKPSRRWKGNIRMDFKSVCRTWSGLIWLRIGIGGGLCDHSNETSGSKKIRGISWVAEKPLVSQEGLPHGVSSLDGCVLKFFQRFGYSIFALFRVDEKAEDVNRSYSLMVELTLKSLN